MRKFAHFYVFKRCFFEIESPEKFPIEALSLKQQLCKLSVKVKITRRWEKNYVNYVVFF